MRYCVCQFSGKTNSFNFFSPNLPKSGSRVDNLENYCRNNNQHPRYTICANFQSRWTILNFSTQICPKKDLGFKTGKNNVGIRINIVQTLCMPIQKTSVGIRIIIVNMLCVPIFRKNGQLAQKWILGLQFQKSKSGFGSNTSKIPCVPVFSQNGLLIFNF